MTGNVPIRIDSCSETVRSNTSVYGGCYIVCCIGLNVHPDKCNTLAYDRGKFHRTATYIRSRWKISLTDNCVIQYILNISFGTVVRNLNRGTVYSAHFRNFSMLISGFILHFG